MRPMRTFLHVLQALLLLITVAAFREGFAAAQSAAVSQAFIAAALPLLLGTVALGAAAVILAIDLSTRSLVAAINRGTEVAINEARHAAHHRAASRP